VIQLSPKSRSTKRRRFIGSTRDAPRLDRVEQGSLAGLRQIFLVPDIWCQDFSPRLFKIFSAVSRGVRDRLRVS
jgi:hypothetical protein